MSNLIIKADRIKELEQERMLLLEIIKQQDTNKNSDDETWEVVSHELRTPLVPIQGYVDLLLSGKMGKLDNQQIKRLKIVQSNTKSIIDLVNKIVESRNLDAAKTVNSKRFKL